MLHVENLKQSTDGEMEKAIRSVIVHKATDTMFIAAVLLDRYFKCNFQKLEVYLTFLK